jgi:hypothetical protein
MLVRAGGDGGLLVIGEAPPGTRWDDVRLAATSDGPGHFVGLFDPSGVCRALRPLPGRVSVAQAAAIPGGGFVIGGGYVERVAYAGRMTRSEGIFDANAFLLRVDGDGNRIWLRSIGEPGNTRAGYRSREAVLDLAVRDDGSIVSAMLRDRRGRGRDELVITTWDADGMPIAERIIDRDVRPPGSVALALTDEGDTIVCYSAATVAPGADVPASDAPKTMHLQRLARDGTILSEHAESAAVNTMARSAAVHGGTLWLTGHYQGEVRWGDDVLVNSGVHQLFVLVQPVD